MRFCGVDIEYHIHADTDGNITILNVINRCASRIRVIKLNTSRMRVTNLMCESH